MIEALESGETALTLGPGARLAALRPILAALAGRSAGPTVRTIGDLDELGDVAGVAGLARPLVDAGTLMLDADLVPIEDLGWLRRLLLRRPRLRLVLIGDDAGRRSARALLRLAGTRWTSWPPDVEDLEEIAGVAGSPAKRAGPVAPAIPVAAAAAPPIAGRKRGVPPARSPALDEQLSEIEAILEMPAESERRERGERIAPPGREFAIDRATERPPVAPPTDRALATAAPLAERTEAAPAAPVEGTERPPHYFRDQVADLADIAQRIDLALDALRSAGAEHTPPAAVDELRGEVARLVQFTRTLGYLVAPPPPGDQVFDLDEMIRVIVADLVARGPDSPRCLWRGSGTLTVRSDRQLLNQAFDALFFLVRFAAKSGEIVRVQWSSEESQPRLARISIEFPSGPLRELSAAQIVEPYGLRRLLPELGPNALSAAIGILRGQGGNADLRRAHAGRLEWIVTLPRHVEKGHDGSPSAENPHDNATPAAGPDEPFA